MWEKGKVKEERNRHLRQKKRAVEIRKGRLRKQPYQEKKEKGLGECETSIYECNKEVNKYRGRKNVHVER